MKKLFTTIIAFSTVAMGFAQAPVTGNAQAPAPKPNQEVIDLEMPAFYKYNSANLPASAWETRSGRGAVEFIPIGTAYNLYTILLDGQNQVSYHPDINSVSFIHRQNNGTTGGSGGLSFDVSTDGGATWNTNYILTPEYNAGTSAVTGNRYPSAAIYNPAGNTDPSAAFIVGNGPALDPLSGAASWGYTFRVSANLDGSNVDEVYYQTPGAPYDFHPYSINSYESGSMWSLSTTYNNTGDPTQEFISYENFYVNEITYNAGTMTFDYATTDLTPDFYEYVNADGVVENMAGQGWSVEFDPTGTTGYITFLAGADGASPLVPKPYLYKTTDGGATWSILPDFDFGTLTTFQDWTIPTWDGEIIPYFTSHDAVVDADGTLHLFAECLGRSTTNTTPDSLFFIWTGLTTFMHLTTTDGTDWTAELIGFSQLPSATIGTVGIPFRMQASVTPDGEKVFFSRTASDSTIFYDHSAPDLYVIGYDIASGEYTNEVNVSAGTDFEYSMYYATMAPYAMDNDAGEYELPIVFAVPGPDDLSPPQFYYVKGVTFTDADFGAEPAAVANFTFSVGTGGLVSFSNTSSNATSYSLDFGDGSGISPLENPTYTYTANGLYNVCLTASNATSSDENCKDVNVTNVGGAIENAQLSAALNIFPTPANSVLQVTLDNNSFGNMSVSVHNLLGEAVIEPIMLNGTAMSLDVNSLPAGQYLLRLTGEAGSVSRQFSIIR